MVDHYNNLEQIAKPSFTAEILSSSASSQASSSATHDVICSYQNKLKDFKPVFPGLVCVLVFSRCFFPVSSHYLIIVN